MRASRAAPRIWDTDWFALREINRSLQAIFARHLRPGWRVLDFGCGEMPYRACVEERHATYLGADFDAGADVHISPEGRLSLPDASVDMVLSVQVLEHVRDLDAYFAEISRVLKPQGVLVLSTHGTWLYHPHPEDHRRWTRTGLVHDIQARGFHVCEIESIIGPLGTTTMIRSTGFAFVLRRLPVFGRLFAGILASLMNVRAWLEEQLTPEQVRTDNGCVYMTFCERLCA